MAASPPPRSRFRPRGRSGPSRTRTTGGRARPRASARCSRTPAPGRGRRRDRPHRPDARPGAPRRRASTSCAPPSCGTTSAPAPSATRSRGASGRNELIPITGNDALTGFTAPKILWVRNHEPEVYAKARHVLLPKDYVRLRLTGEYAMDKADGSGTILFDLKARTWSKLVLGRSTSRPTGCRPRSRAPRSTGHGHGRGRGRDGPAGRHAGDGRRRRPGRRRRGRGRGPARGRLADPRHLRRRLRHDRRPAGRAGGPAARLLPRRARPLALHGRDALAPPAACSGTATRWRRGRASTTSWPRPS